MVLSLAANVAELDPANVDTTGEGLEYDVIVVAVELLDMTDDGDEDVDEEEDGTVGD